MFKTPDPRIYFPNVSDEELDNLLGNEETQPADLTLDQMYKCNDTIGHYPHLQKYRPALEAAYEVYQARREKDVRTVFELSELIDNYFQKKTLRDWEDYLIFSDYSKYYTFFRDFREADAKEKAKGVAGVFSIWGQYEHKKQKRALYEVKLFAPGSNGAKGSFWCSCPEHRFNSAKKDIVCKHICFIVCKVGKILDPEFFKTKWLTDAQMSKLLEGVKTNDFLRTADLHRAFYDFKITWTRGTPCPSCRELIKEKTNDIVKCPVCESSNPYWHKKCADEYYKTNDGCKFCGYNIWKDEFREGCEARLAAEAEAAERH